MKNHILTLSAAVMALNCAQFSLAASMCGAEGGAEPAAPTFAGKVIATTNASRYTYVQVDTGKEKIWAAGPATAVKVGDCVSLDGAMPNKSFYSASLKRTFDELYFVEAIKPCAPGACSAGVCPSGVSTNGACGKGTCGKGTCASDAPMGGPASVAVSAAPVENIEKAVGGKTVAEVWAEKDALAGKPVVVRGRVVKMVPNIMGKTFLHLRDGTGSEGSNDLTVTTRDAVQLKSIVTATGVLTTDKDFGAGYKYDVILEDASVSAK